MREIKFRVWDKENKFFNSDYSINGDYVYGYCEGRIIKKDEQDKLVFMQFTGLKDKNGKEIYEGDIVSWYEKDSEDTIHIIEWIDQQGCWGTKDEIWLCNTNMNFKVIGNIYESKHLLDNIDTKV
mgnify:CR=1 FL=1